MSDTADRRMRMVRDQVARRGVSDERVLDAMRAVPREAFVDPGMAEFAYDDAPLPIAEGQTVSQPFIVGMMLAAVDPEPGERLLEVGLGSGYAAAVASRVVGMVYGIERHATLARKAEHTFRELGYDNIAVGIGDGSLGWPEAGPFDAILVAAGGPRVPQALQHQLKVGGRLVIPVDTDGGAQRLIRVTRTDEQRFETEDLGCVRFVPLVGAEGWPVRDRSAPRTVTVDTADLVADGADPLPDPDSPDFAAAFDHLANKRVVLLGESSHGTSEFYRARAAITQRLVDKHGFNIVAVEADWPDAAAVDRRVRHRDGARRDAPFSRFPTWMWRNEEFAEFVDWLRDRNRGLEPARQAAFYGLDLYNMRAAIAAVLDYLDAHDPEAAAVARERYGCLVPWQREPSTYGRAVLTEGYRSCEPAVVAQCRDMLERRIAAEGRDRDDLFDATQNARVVQSAERYYRAMYYGGATAWNLRDRHMFDTLRHILSGRGRDAKAVVWAHNSHIGDARHTEMGAVRDELNIGQLVREWFGDAAALVGFGTHSGTVAAAADWGGPMHVMSVNPSHSGSYERVCHDASMRAGEPRFLLDLCAARTADMSRELSRSRPERFIGVIYRPETELLSHYAQASLPGQFDAWVWFDETKALAPLAAAERRDGLPDTWPFGV